jgi:riboflavin synthase
MFTGIVQGVASIRSLADRPGLRRLTLALPPGFADGLQIGASVSVDGVCLTVTALKGSSAADFDAMLQTLSLTTLGALKAGDRVNVERAAPAGAEVGGHPLSGHIDFSASIAAISHPQDNHVLRMSVPAPWMRYLFAKGYVALNGASLTLAEVHRESDGSGWFEVWLIPETLRMTTFAHKRMGAAINVEIDRQTQILVDTIRDAIAERVDAFAHSMKLSDAVSISRRSPQRSASALSNGGLRKMATKKKAKGKAKKKAKPVKVKKKAKAKAKSKPKAKARPATVKKKTKPRKAKMKPRDEPPDGGGGAGSGGEGPHAMMPQDEPPDGGGGAGSGGEGPHTMMPQDEPPDGGGGAGSGGEGPHTRPRKKK